MIILYEQAFLRDIKKIRDQKISDNLAKIIKKIKQTNDLSALGNIKKLKGHPSAFRIKINDYRLGFFFENGHVIMIRFLQLNSEYRKTRFLSLYP
jgi:mRNA interferase RelE/StbE